jgi:hypothetical protein
MRMRKNVHLYCGGRGHQFLVLLWVYFTTLYNWRMMTWKGFRRKRSWHSRGILREFSWEVWGKQRKASVRIADVPVYIPNGHLQDTGSNIRNTARCRLFMSSTSFTLHTLEFCVQHTKYMLQTGRSRVLFPMRSLDFSIDLILPPALWPCGRLSL